MKKNIIQVIVGIVILGVGFFAGMEYKANEMRTAIAKAFSSPTIPTTQSDKNESNKTNTVAEEIKKENLNLITKAVGDDVVGATLTYKIIKSEEQQIINASYGSPKVAKEGAKFIVINVAATNTTNKSFSFPTNEVFRLIDNKDREYESYRDSIGTDNYIDYRDLSPGVKEMGVLIYEVPTDATNYHLLSRKAGSKDAFKVVLK